jgi:CBS domain-containing protein
MVINHDRPRVHDWMHPGIVSCAEDTPVGEVARMMGDYRVHAIAVADVAHGRPWGTWRIVSDVDLMAAVAAGDEATAAELAGTEAITIPADAPLEVAAQLMSAQRVAHLVVVDQAGGFPIGIISTLDIASAYGRGQAGRASTAPGSP